MHELLNRAIERDKIENNKENLAESYVNLGYAYFWDLKYKEALEAYNKAIEIKPDYHKALCNKGNALVALGRHEEAQKAFDKSNELIKNLKK